MLRVTVELSFLECVIYDFVIHINEVLFYASTKGLLKELLRLSKSIDLDILRDFLIDEHSKASTSKDFER